MPPKPNCYTCEYKRLQVKANSEVSVADNAHCYMFEKEPKACMQWKAVNVGTKGNSQIAKVFGFQPILDDPFSEIFGDIFGGGK